MYEFTSTTLWNGDVYKKIVVDTDKKQLEIFRQGVYKNDATHHVCLYWTKGHAAYLDVLKLETIKIACADPTLNYRLCLYINSIGNADPLFANDFVFKGRPVFVEFGAGQTEEVLESLVKNLNKYLNVTFDHQIIIPASELANEPADGKSEVSFEDVTVATDPNDATYLVCANEYMRIGKAIVEQYDEDKDTWKQILDLKIPTACFTGAEGFGTYDHLEKDYRLPTAANLRWKRPQADEMPRPGVQYDQVTVHYTVHRGHVGGMGAVGQQVTSETTHVFWIPSDIVENDFVGKFAGTGTDSKGETNTQAFEIPLEKKETEGSDTIAYRTADYAHQPVVKDIEEA